MYQALLHKCHAVRAGLCLVCLGNPLCEVRDPSPHEQIILREERDFHYYLNPRRQAALTAFYPGRSLEDCVRIFDYHSAGLRLVRRNGLLQPAPLQSPFYTVTGGRRRVTDVPIRWQRTLHLLGGAPAIGLFAPDGQTVASQIQRTFNAHAPESVRVLNPANGGSFLEAARQILSPRYPLRPGDLLVLLLYECDSQALAEAVRAVPAARNFLTCLTAGDAFQRPHDYGEIFFDARHMGPGGYALLAGYLFPHLLARLEAPDLAAPPELEAFAAHLRHLRQRHGTPPGGVGGIVLPAPLPEDGPARIARARSRCALLYVFLPDQEANLSPAYAEALAEPGTVAVACPSLPLPAATLEPYFPPRQTPISPLVAEDPALFASLVADTLGIRQTF